MPSIEIDSTDGTGDNLTVRWTRDGGLCFEGEEPWSGDSETGFGELTAINLTHAQAVMLLHWLLETRPEKDIAAEAVHEARSRAVEDKA